MLKLTCVMVFIFLVYPNFKTIECKLTLSSNSEETSTLVLLNIVFRHGNRTVNGRDELYPKDPYLNETYYPFGIGQLTNVGKKREFSIGQALRSNYNNFLGDYYTPDVVDAQTTDYNRTKMSLQLVLAGLFPPRRKEIWNYLLNWQPVPYNYLPLSQDKVLVGVVCPNYIKLYNQQTVSMQQQTEFNKYKEYFEYISISTGLNITTFQQVYNLFFALSTEEEWGFRLPRWTDKVWPKVITELAIKEYFVATATTALRRLAVGYFLQKIILDSRAKITGRALEGRKMYLYSAHESNVAQTLLVLGIFDPPHVPTYGSYLVFELHLIEGNYGFKIFYQNYSTKKPQLLKLPACDTFCKFDQFVSLIEEYFPEENACGN